MAAQGGFAYQNGSLELVGVERTSQRRHAEDGGLPFEGHRNDGGQLSEFAERKNRLQRVAVQHRRKASRSTQILLQRQARLGVEVLRQLNASRVIRASCHS